MPSNTKTRPARRTSTPARRVGGRAPQATIDQRLLKAMSHPLRFRILLALNEGTASPKELSDRLEEPLGNVAYHTRILLDLDAVELVDTAQRRGATEHYYRAVMRPYFTDDEFAGLPLPTRRSIFAPAIRTILQDVSAAAAETGFDDPRAHASWTKLDLDEQGFEELADALGELLERALAIQAECLGRRIDAGDDAPPAIATELAVAHFHRPAGSKPQAFGKRRRPAKKTKR